MVACVHLCVYLTKGNRAMTHEGTCPICGCKVQIVNYERWSFGELGYLGRHWRPGIRRDAKCRGSFGYWTEKKSEARVIDRSAVRAEIKARLDEAARATGHADHDAELDADYAQWQTRVGLSNA